MKWSGRFELKAYFFFFTHGRFFGIGVFNRAFFFFSLFCEASLKFVSRYVFLVS